MKLYLGIGAFFGVIVFVGGFLGGSVGWFPSAMLGVAVGWLWPLLAVAVAFFALASSSLFPPRSSVSCWRHPPALPSATAPNRGSFRDLGK